MAMMPTSMSRMTWNVDIAGPFYAGVDATE
jgi:hypothetical protein